MAERLNHLRKLKKFYRNNQRMPSYAELAGLFGFASKNAAKYRVDKWIEAGVLSKDSAGKLLPGKSFRPIYVLGTIKAGIPPSVGEENINTKSLDEWLIGSKKASFMLSMSDDSMIEEGIRSGDRVILERDRKSKNGDIVVAEVNYNWVVRYYSQQGSRVILKPANKKYRSIVAQKDLRVAGVVTAVIRKY